MKAQKQKISNLVRNQRFLNGANGVNKETIKKKYVVRFEDVGIEDVGLVGGKNASLGEMIRYLAPKGINIPNGFIITTDAYRYFLKETKLDEFIKETLKDLNTKNLKNLAKRAKLIRETIKKYDFPKELNEEIVSFYREMEKKHGNNVDVAVRSSATAEDLPGASFAGAHETYLNIQGEEDLLKASRAAMASLFTDRAISYRVDKNFNHFKVALSVGVQKMVRSDMNCSGVMFTLDTESGFKNVVLINGSWGLGDMIVQGKVTPDEFLVFKPLIGKLRETAQKNPSESVFRPIIDKKMGNKDKKMIYSLGAGIKKTRIIGTSLKEKENFVLSDEEVVKLANWGVIIENYYSDKNQKWTPMDIEWAKDGRTNELFIVQARPETIHADRDFSKIKEYIREENGKIITKGASVGNKIVIGKARVILNAKNANQFRKGEILITDMTNPDWEPIMKIASAIVTDKGGRVSHAAIVSRELGIPCIVGAGNATSKIKTGQIITVDTTGSDGLIFSGALKFKIVYHNVEKFPKPKTKIYMNIATPETAFEKSFLPNSGVGLAREEFIIASGIGIHPMALINFKEIYQKSKIYKRIVNEIEKRTIGYKDKTQFYVDKLAYGIAKIAAAFHPKEVIIRFSDFKTNEYRSLLGGELYEPNEENPMLGWRGASRYYDAKFKPAFILELKAIKKAREEMGLDNIAVMVPFCRTPEEGRKVLEIIEKNGLRGTTSQYKSTLLKVYVMCEIPSNIILADEFLEIFDGMSIGSNDLAQLTLGLDRDSGIIPHIANENNPAVRMLITDIVKKCLAKDKYIGICGQAPSDYPEFAQFLVRLGINSISLNPDTIIPTTLKIYEEERRLKEQNY